MAGTKLKLIEVNIQPSLRLLLLMMFCLSASCAALGLAVLPVFLKLTVLLGLVAFSIRYHRQFIALKHPESIQAVRLVNDQWRVRTGSGWSRSWPEGEVIVTSFMICCRMRVEGQQRPSYLILCSDSADPVELHGLRLKLMLDGSSCLASK